MSVVEYMIKQVNLIIHSRQTVMYTVVVCKVCVCILCCIYYYIYV